MTRSAAPRCLDCRRPTEWAGQSWQCHSCGADWDVDDDPRYAPPADQTEGNPR